MIQLIRTKRKGVSLMVNYEGALIVRAPVRASNYKNKQIIVKNQDWIEKQKVKAQETIRERKKNRLVNSEGVLILGKRMKPKGLSLANEALVKEWCKAKALKIIERKLNNFSEKFDLRYKKIRITNARTRWGSCSYDNSLNFSWKLITAPKKVVDYVLIHEMAHLRHKNHSKRFWDLVEEMMPDYKKYDEWLKKNHFLLHF